MVIHPRVWTEFMVYAKATYRIKPDADLYDVFMLWRYDLGNQPFSQEFIKQIDYEIKAEERRNLRRAQENAT